MPNFDDIDLTDVIIDGDPYEEFEGDDEGSDFNLDDLPVSNSALYDLDQIIFKKNSNSTWYRRSITAVWTYIKKMLSSNTPSHVGQIIHSTTLDTEVKVKAIYGTSTSWIQHTGYVLRGATTNVSANSNTNDGGADSVTVSSVANHNHTQNAHAHDLRQRLMNGQAGATSYGFPFQTNQSGTPYTIGGNVTNLLSAQGASVLNATATNNANGADYTVNTLPKYKNVYIWERTV